MTNQGPCPELSRNELEALLSRILMLSSYDDYGPNGLQIEGKKAIRKIAFAVSATKDSVQKAVEAKACALIVHHGLFWKFHGPRPITGPFYKRVAPLIQHEINLFAYHLPLDGHIDLGNAASLAKLLEPSCTLEIFLPTKDKKTGLGVMAHFSQGIDAEELKERLTKACRHTVMHSRPESNQIVHKLAIITGGANREWKEALKIGADCYLTGEMSEHDWHEASEAGIHMMAAGHHATEQFGILALRDWLLVQFPFLETLVIESENPA